MIYTEIPDKNVLKENDVILTKDTFMVITKVTDEGFEYITKNKLKAR